jgi:hypothetical protein
MSDHYSPGENNMLIVLPPYFPTGVLKLMGLHIQHHGMQPALSPANQQTAGGSF